MREVPEARRVIAGRVLQWGHGRPGGGNLADSISECLTPSQDLLRLLPPGYMSRCIDLLAVDTNELGHVVLERAFLRRWDTSLENHHRGDPRIPPPEKPLLPLQSSDWLEWN